MIEKFNPLRILKTGIYLSLQHCVPQPFALLNSLIGAEMNDLLSPGRAGRIDMIQEEKLLLKLDLKNS